MKRLVFCFDGTWNKLAADTPTNVVLTAASIERVTQDGTVQVIHYDEGVGTGRLERLSGGMFGAGLTDNIREAYRFLIFNYDPGDEIFVFGFSRGAYSARSFVGLMRHVGPLSRIHADRIDEALDLYRRRLRDRDGATDVMRRFRADYAGGVCIGTQDETWRCASFDGYAPGSSPEFKVRYLGVWDTVAALGMPEIVPGHRWFNRKHRFHDVSLDPFVERARHAIAIDEGRALFPPVPWDNVDALNATAGVASHDPKAPYQQKWFPGVHGGVGGGGDVRGLSDGALTWILRGAKLAGLHLDTARGTRINGFHPDSTVSVVNSLHPEFSVTGLLRKGRAGPARIEDLAPSAVRRWHTPAGQLAERAAYRPPALAHLAKEIDAAPYQSFDPTTEIIATHVVEKGEWLSRIALRYYGDASAWREIYHANLDVIDDPDDIFPGWKLRIPKLASPGNLEGAVAGSVAPPAAGS